MTLETIQIIDVALGAEDTASSEHRTQVLQASSYLKASFL